MNGATESPTTGTCNASSTARRLSKSRTRCIVPVRDSVCGMTKVTVSASCAGLEALLQTYATVINELARENDALREQHQGSATVTPLKPGR
jgi:hypothetical protein